jgi:hypothetical protein
VTLPLILHTMTDTVPLIRLNRCVLGSKLHIRLDICAMQIRANSIRANSCRLDPTAETVANQAQKVASQAQQLQVSSNSCKLGPTVPDQAQTVED